MGGRQQRFCLHTIELRQSRVYRENNVTRCEFLRKTLVDIGKMNWRGTRFMAGRKVNGVGQCSRVESVKQGQNLNGTGRRHLCKFFTQTATLSQDTRPRRRA